MAINIPDGMIDKYNEACDFFINNDIIGANCTLVYPPKKTPCNNCIKPAGMNSVNVYRHGGPMPFNFGSCPLCGGNGYSEVEVTEPIRLRTYFNRSDWIRVASTINIDDADVMVIGFMADLPKFKRAVQILLVSDQTVAEYRSVSIGKPAPWGFRGDRYFVAYLKGA